MSSFITTWETTTTDESITLPLASGFNYSFTVDWGDFSSDDTITAWDDLAKTHLYSTADTYTVTITGTVEAWNFKDNTSSKNKIKTIEQWGTVGFINLYGGFYYCQYLTDNAIDQAGAFGNVTVLSYVGGGYYYPDLNYTNWDTSSVTDMSYVFSQARYSEFASPTFDLSNWDVSSVTNVYKMFDSSFIDFSLGNWNFTSLTSMSNMFYRAYGISCSELGNWSFPLVTNMESMFEATGIANPDVSNWDVSSVTNMSSMFDNADAANPDVSNWNTSSVTELNSMFNSNDVADPDVSNWDTSHITSFDSLFSGAISANPDVSNWDTSSCTSFYAMFADATSADPNMSNWNTSKVTILNRMFYGAIAATCITTRSWDTSSVTNMYYAFRDAYSADPNVTNWDTSSVTEMRSLFYNTKATNLDVSNWNFNSISSGAYMGGMFSDAREFSDENFNKALKKWSGQILPTNAFIYTVGAARPYFRSIYKDKIELLYNWTFTNDGEVLNPDPESIDVINASPLNTHPISGSEIEGLSPVYGITTFSYEFNQTSSFPDVVFPNSYSFSFEAKEFLYSFNLIVENEAEYPYDLNLYTPVLKESEFGFNYSAINEYAFNYSFETSISNESDFLYNLELYSAVTKETEFGFNYTATEEYAFVYSYAGGLFNEAEFGYELDLRTSLENEFIFGYQYNAYSEHAFPYNLSVVIFEEFEYVYDYVSPLEKQQIFGYELEGRNPVNSEKRFIYNLLEAQTVRIITPTFYLYDEEGNPIPFIEADISTDEDSYVWSATVLLSDLSDYVNFGQDDIFEIYIMDDVYKFIVDSKTMSRTSPSEVQYTLVGVSGSARFDSPRFDSLYSKTWDAPVMALTAAEDTLSTITPTTLPWDLINWQLPAYRLILEKMTALAVVESLVTAVGGVLQSEASTGELYARKLYPVSVPAYATAISDHSFNEVEDILTSSSQILAGKIVNKLRILDFESSYQDVLVFKESEDSILEGHLRAFPSPWREPANVSVTATNCDARITLQPLGVESLLMPELDDEGEPLGEEWESIEIVEGEGSVQYPIWTMVNILWDSCVLGSVSFEPGGKTISITSPTTPAYGLIRIKYMTKFHNYYVQSLEYRPTQFIMKDVQPD